MRDSSENVGSGSAHTVIEMKGSPGTKGPETKSLLAEKTKEVTNSNSSWFSFPSHLIPSKNSIITFGKIFVGVSILAGTAAATYYVLQNNSTSSSDPQTSTTSQYSTYSRNSTMEAASEAVSNAASNITEAASNIATNLYNWITKNLNTTHSASSPENVMAEPEGFKQWLFETVKSFLEENPNLTDRNGALTGQANSRTSRSLLPRFANSFIDLLGLALTKSDGGTKRGALASDYAKQLLGAYVAQGPGAPG